MDDTSFSVVCAWIRMWLDERTSGVYVLVLHLSKQTTSTNLLNTPHEKVI